MRDFLFIILLLTIILIGLLNMNSLERNEKSFKELDVIINEENKILTADEKDSYDTALKMGYTDEQIHFLLENGFSYDSILNPESNNYDCLPQFVSEDQKIKLGAYWAFGDSGNGLAIIYLKDMEKNIITIFDEIKNDFSDYGLLNNKYIYIFDPEITGKSTKNALLFYRYDNCKNVHAKWTPPHKQDEEIIWGGVQKWEQRNCMIIFWLAKPRKLDILQNEEYQNLHYYLSIVNYDGISVSNIIIPDNVESNRYSQLIIPEIKQMEKDSFIFEYLGKEYIYNYNLKRFQQIE